MWAITGTLDVPPWWGRAGAEVNGGHQPGPHCGRVPSHRPHCCLVTCRVKKTAASGQRRQAGQELDMSRTQDTSLCTETKGPLCLSVHANMGGVLGRSARLAVPWPGHAVRKRSSVLAPSCRGQTRASWSQRRVCSVASSQDHLLAPWAFCGEGAQAEGQGVHSGPGGYVIAESQALALGTIMA